MTETQFGPYADPEMAVNKNQIFKPIHDLIWHASTNLLELPKWQ